MLEKPPQFNVASKVLPLLYQISLLVFNPFAPENLAKKNSKLLEPFSGTNTAQNISLAHASAHDAKY